MPVDSFKYLPPSIAGYYRNMPVQKEEPIGWTPLAKPLNECRVALVTTAGIYVKDVDPPFMMMTDMLARIVSARDAGKTCVMILPNPVPPESVLVKRRMAVETPA